MSSETKNLKLFKWDTSNQNDLKSQFDLNKSINENWDKIDEAIGAKADSVEVQSQIDALTAENQSYKRQIPKGQASGDSITINDSSDLSIESIMLKGKTYQETREGYNMCPTDVSNWELGHHSTIQGEKSDETDNFHNQRARVKDLIKVTPNTPIYFNTFNDSYLLFSRAYDINKTYIGNLGVVKNGEYATTSETCGYISIGIYKPSGSSANEGQTIINKIASGEIKPYVGEIATPSIDFPSPIQSVTGENEVGVNNKNWLQTGNIPSGNGITVTKINETTYKFNGTCTTEGRLLATKTFNIENQSYYALSFKTMSGTITNGVMRVYMYGGNDSWNKLSESCSLASDSGSITTFNKGSQAQLGIWVDKGAVANDLIVSFQFEKGDTATDYIEHQSQNYPISLGENEIYEDGYLNIEYEQNAGYKRVTRASIVNGYEKTILDGTENWYSWPTGTANVNRYSTIKIKTPCYKVSDNSIVADLFCNYFKKTSANDTYNKLIEGIALDKSGNLIIFAEKFASDTDTSNLVKWLSENQVEVVYPLATPKETEITDATLLSQLEALINAETYKNITHINTTNEGLKPEIEVVYKKDLETMFNNLNTAVIAIGGV